MTICTRGLGSKNLIPTAGLGTYDIAEELPIPEGGGAGTEYRRRRGSIEEENEIIMAVIIKFLEKEG